MAKWPTSERSATNWATWPEVPKKDQPKRLYVAESMSPEDRAMLVELGWNPIDVRLLPNESDAHRAECIKAWLEGVRLTSITADPRVVKLIELEARTYGLVGTKPTVESTIEEKPEVDIEELLDFKSTRAKLKRKPTRLPEKRTGRKMKRVKPKDEEIEAEKEAEHAEEFLSAEGEQFETKIQDLGEPKPEPFFGNLSSIFSDEATT